MRRLPDAEAALRALEVHFEVQRTRDLDHARELAREAHGAGEIPVALSGDGLVGAVAGALSGREGAVFGILPGGRGNDLARVLGIPRDDTAAACRVLAQGRERPIDLGDVDGRPFVGIASLGFDSDANRIANEGPSRLGPLVYAYGAIRALVSWRPARFTVELEGAPPTSHFGWAVACANNQAYGGGMHIAPDAELDDGLLDVVVTEQTSKPRFLRQLPRIFKGTHVRAPEVSVRRAASVRVDADRPFVVYADGDPIGTLPCTVSIRPRAVSVLVP